MPNVIDIPRVYFVDYARRNKVDTLPRLQGFTTRQVQVLDDDPKLRRMFNDAKLTAHNDLSTAPMGVRLSAQATVRKLAKLFQKS
ncbi:MAG: hypothetical protein FKY71_08110 [Spiribacter salinus]|uniref:Uncharacterized protein n=1 Tax=Spiribacter salinus TaxID=1335746 RepID=A0A540VRZ6_9GAMM|nr:MAG: hypothetical protein FKY71_08110 [Spiribacter salinus]